MSIKDEVYSRALISSLFPLPEYDPDEDTENQEIDPELEADMFDIINQIGTPEFKNLYLITNYSFKHIDLDTQIRFCFDIMDKILEVYGFISPTTLYYNSMNDIKNVYEFLEFLEFKNSLFLQIILTGLVSDIRKLDIDRFLEENWDRIINRINNVTKQITNPIINSFLLINTKDNLIQFLTRLIKRNMLDVTLELFKL